MPEAETRGDGVDVQVGADDAGGGPQRLQQGWSGQGGGEGEVRLVTLGKVGDGEVGLPIGRLRHNRGQRQLALAVFPKPLERELQARQGNAAEPQAGAVDRHAHIERRGLVPPRRRKLQPHRPMDVQRRAVVAEVAKDLHHVAAVQEEAEPLDDIGRQGAPEVHLQSPRLEVKGGFAVDALPETGGLHIDPGVVDEEPVSLRTQREGDALRGDAENRRVLDRDRDRTREEGAGRVGGIEQGRPVLQS